MGFVSMQWFRPEVAIRSSQFKPHWTRSSCNRSPIWRIIYSIIYIYIFVIDFYKIVLARTFSYILCLYVIHQMYFLGFFKIIFDINDANGECHFKKLQIYFRFLRHSLCLILCTYVLSRPFYELCKTVLIPNLFWLCCEMDECSWISQNSTNLMIISLLSD